MSSPLLHAVSPYSSRIFHLVSLLIPSLRRSRTMTSSSKPPRPHQCHTSHHGDDDTSGMAAPSHRHSLRADQVPDHFRELYIQSAYRNPNSSIRECVCSVFEATNETFNFWTHIIPSAYFIWWTYVIFRDDVSLSEDPAYTVPFLVYCVSVCAFPTASALAHVFNTMSDHARHVCFFIDYAALSFFALGSAIAYRAYSFPKGLQGSQFSSVYFPAAAIISILSMTSCSATRLMPNNILKKVLRMSSMAFPYLFDLIPIGYRYLFGDDEDLAAGMVPHMRQFIFTFLSAFFYISHLPERAFPGYFDVFGHSHQIFHTATVLGARDQLMAILTDMKERRHIVHDDNDTFYIVCVIVMVIIAMVNFGQLLLFSSQVHRIIPCKESSPSWSRNDGQDHGADPAHIDVTNNNNTPSTGATRRKLTAEYVQ